MSIGIGAEDHDPLDMSRRLIERAALDAAEYADMVAKLIGMRDDDRAHAMFGAVLTQVANLKTGFSALAAGRTAAPGIAARKHFDGLSDGKQVMTP